MTEDRRQRTEKSTEFCGLTTYGRSVLRSSTWGL